MFPHPPQILHKPLFSKTPGSTAFSQEHLRTITYTIFLRRGKQSVLWGYSKTVSPGLLGVNFIYRINLFTRFRLNAAAFIKSLEFISKLTCPQSQRLR